MKKKLNLTKQDIFPFTTKFLLSKKHMQLLFPMLPNVPQQTQNHSQPQVPGSVGTLMLHSTVFKPQRQVLLQVGNYSSIQARSFKNFPDRREKF